MALTPIQQRVLDYIADCAQRNGVTPTLAEIAVHFNWRSRNAARKHVQELIDRGFLKPQDTSKRLKLADAHSRGAVTRGLPIVGRIAAGQPILAPEHVDDWLELPAELFRPAADFLHRVSGDSMVDLHILDGDLVAIRAQSWADSGQVVAAVVPDRHGDDCITLKRLFMEGRRIELRSENRARGYPPIRIETDDYDPEGQGRAPLQIAGVYVGLVRGLSS